MLCLLILQTKELIKHYRDNMILLYPENRLSTDTKTINIEV